jgi:hypothetical protein
MPTTRGATTQPLYDAGVTQRPPADSPLVEGFVEIDGEGFYAIPDADRLGPFLMSIVSDADHWMFVSSRGGLTAGRGDSALALFPYETEDRLHVAGGVTGPVTAIRLEGPRGPTLWEPFRGGSSSQIRRNLYKSVVGNQIIFEEANLELGLVFRYRWSHSERFGFARTSTLSNIGDHPMALSVLDGLVNLLPFGLDPSLYQRVSSLTNAYKRSEVVDPETRLAVYSLESHVVDQPEPAEVLSASIAWSVGFGEADLALNSDLLESFQIGQPREAASLVTGRPGAYLLSGNIALDPGEGQTWLIVADVARDQGQVAGLRDFLRSAPDPGGEMATSVRHGTESLVAIMARSDALQRAGDRVATAHHFANVTYNVMRGGIFNEDHSIDTTDFADFLASRNRVVAARHRSQLQSLPDIVDRAAFVREVEVTGDAQLMRLVLEYLPLTFSRRHGDPSRPWNEFSIRVRDEDGQPIIYYEGNWRDIFQNWEALCLSFPAFLPSIVSVFVDASTPDGFNAYRISRQGIDWEVPDPSDPWSNIGYWGDHQIVYLHRLLEATRRYLPGELERLLDRAWFSYADVPYGIASYEEMVSDPKSTIRFDEVAAGRSAERVEELGQDGKLLSGPDGQVCLVTLLEKLLVPALSKLSNYVPGGGIWMNAQRPEWNDANNALVGHGASMVTLYQLRSYLRLLIDTIVDSGLDEADLSIEVAEWFDTVFAILSEDAATAVGGFTDEQRRGVMDGLGHAFSDYRTRVDASDHATRVSAQTRRIVEFCETAIGHLDSTIRLNRRPDGLYHSYNLVEFDADGSAAHLGHLYEMLEGQVAVLSSGFLTAEEKVGVIEALFASAMFRPDQRSFTLYPPRRPPSFLDKNVLPDTEVAKNPLLLALLESGDGSIVTRDVDGRYRFCAAFRNGSDLETALNRLADQDEWQSLVSANRTTTLDAYENLFRHHEYTGRSGSMYGYEGIGSIYWHMVAKLLVAVQEAVLEAQDEGASPATVRSLVDAYWRVRSGLGFNKTAPEYGAFPTDPYSHTPAHAGAQQPGMTGQVKEELLSRLLETGVRIVDGEIRFDPILLRTEDLVPSPEEWKVHTINGSWEMIVIPPHSLGMTLCQVPVIVTLSPDLPSIEVTFADGTRREIGGVQIDRETSGAIFERTGRVARVVARIPNDLARAQREDDA